MSTATWKDHTIIVRADDSYLISKNGDLYHVPNEGEWTALHIEVTAYAEEHPEQVEPEKVREITVDEARRNKAEEILCLADMAKNRLSSSFSKVEESTWPEQEAGARSILGAEKDTKNVMARLILADAAALAAAVSLVETLARIDGVTTETFAERIATNADMAHHLGLWTLSEQRGYETQLKEAKTVAQIQAITVAYTVLAKNVA